MQYYFAPMEGVTGALYRACHHQYFGGVDKYFMPFVTPTVHQCFTARQLRDIAPAHNAGVPAVPQLLTCGAPEFIWAANALAEMGYGEVNLNLGCPSGTVTAKGKGAGFLAKPDALDRFFDAVFAQVRVPVSVKTRLGVHDPAEFPTLLAVFNRYPIAELTIHARVRQDFYKGDVRLDDFVRALPESRAPVCYNGDLVTCADIRRAEGAFPAARALMIGRSLIADPALARRAKGGAPADKAELQAFHDALYEGYCTAFGNRRNAMLRMKEIWFYHLNLFENSEKHGKKLKKATDPRDFETQAAAIFRDLPLRADAAFGWYKPI